jgi:hypothetical protein
MNKCFSLQNRTLKLANRQIKCFSAEWFAICSQSVRNLFATCSQPVRNNTYSKIPFLFLCLKRHKLTQEIDLNLFVHTKRFMGKEKNRKLWVKLLEGVTKLERCNKIIMTIFFLGPVVASLDIANERLRSLLKEAI